MTNQAHSTVVNASIIRHGESQFNHAMETFQEIYPNDDIHSDRAMGIFQLDCHLCDSPLTEEGRLQALRVKEESYLQGIEVVFVSPLQRTLETASIIFGNGNIKIVALPDITQILSKVCDISSSISNKKRQFPNIDFSHLEGKQNTWQLELLSPEERRASRRILGQTPSDQEVSSHLMDLLKSHFPQSIQPRTSCTERVVAARSKMAALSHQMGVSKIGVVAHKRVLIEMTRSQSVPQGITMKNCEMRHIQI